MVRVTDSYREYTPHVNKVRRSHSRRRGRGRRRRGNGCGRVGHHIPYSMAAMRAADLPAGAENNEFS